MIPDPFSRRDHGASPVRNQIIYQSLTGRRLANRQWKRKDLRHKCLWRVDALWLSSFSEQICFPITSPYKSSLMIQIALLYLAESDASV